MISAVAEMYEIHPQTLRLYEREGLLKPSRTEGNTRLYTDEDIERLEFILNLARDLGVNIAGIAIILQMRERMEEMNRQMQSFVEYVRTEMLTRFIRPRRDRLRPSCPFADRPWSSPRRQPRPPRAANRAELDCPASTRPEHGCPAQRAPTRFWDLGNHKCPSWKSCPLDAPPAAYPYSCMFYALLALAVFGLIASTIVAGIQLTAVPGYLRERRIALAQLAMRPGFTPPLSLLKPLHGAEPGLEASLATFFEQDYPAFEILFCTRDPDDAGLAIARRVAAHYPHIPARFLSTGGQPPTSTPK